MSFFLNLRRSQFRKSLKKSLAVRQPSEKQIFNLETARSIGILFDGTAEKDRQTVLEFAQKLAQKGKKTRLLGLVDLPEKKVPTELGFVHFDRKNIDWTGRPKSEKADAFAREKFDLVLCLFVGEKRPLEWIAAHSKAKMTAGAKLFFAENVDFSIEMAEKATTRELIQQLEFYVNRLAVRAEKAVEKAVLEPAF